MPPPISKGLAARKPRKLRRALTASSGCCIRSPYVLRNQFSKRGKVNRPLWRWQENSGWLGAWERDPNPAASDAVAIGKLDRAFVGLGDLARKCKADAAAFGLGG